MNILKNIGVGIFAVGSFFAGIFGYHATQQNVGASINTLPNVVANYSDSLAAQEGSTDTSFTLVSGNDPLGRPLQGFYCFTVDAQTSISEFECGTASGTAVSNVTRGIDPLNWNATSSTLINVHRRGASVTITDYTSLGALNRIISGLDTFPSGTVLQYNPNVTTAQIAAALNNVADTQYVNSVVSSGAANASTIVKGIVQEATTAQVASGTNVGSTGADLVTPNRYSSLTASTSPVSVIASGTIDPSYLLNGNYNLGSTTVQGIISASTTLNGTTTITGSFLLNGSVPLFDKFGGTGASGTLSLSSGTVSFNLGGVAVYERDYSSISITGTSSVAFTNPASGGTLIILKSQGNCALTSTTSTVINLASLGGAGGTAITSGGGSVAGNAGSAFGQWTTGTITGGGGGTTGNPGGGNGGASSAGSGNTQSNTTQALAPALLTGQKSDAYIRIPVVPGSGGGSGGADGTGTSGSGGAGAGALYMECGGTLNFSSALSAIGGNGTATGNLGVGGGGGGGGGYFFFIANTIGTNTGTATTTGGTGGAGGGSTGGSVGTAGMTGGLTVVQNTLF